MSNFILLLVSCMTVSTVYSYDKFNLDPYAVDRQTCTQDSECPSSNENIVKVCLGGYCFRRCQSDNNCQSDPPYVCITYQGIGVNGTDESIYKPADCQPCINRPYPPYPTNIPTQAEDEEEEKEVVADDKFDYQAYNMTRQICKTKSDCTGNNDNAIHDCLGGYCFKECRSDNQCRDDPDYVCINYPRLKKSLCKPEKCGICKNRPYPGYPTTEAPDDEIDDEEEEEDEEFDYEDYINKMTRNMCKTASECPSNNKNAVHICLNGYCFKECTSSNQCRDEPDYVCINYPSLGLGGKGLCKPEKCGPCKNNPYPTRMGELQDVLYAADMDNGDGLWSLTSEWENQSLIRLGILIVIGVFIILGLYKLRNGSKGNKEKKVSINESPASAVGISSV